MGEQTSPTKDYYADMIGCNPNGYLVPHRLILWMVDSIYVFMDGWYTDLPVLTHNPNVSIPHINICTSLCLVCPYIYMD